METLFYEKFVFSDAPLFRLTWGETRSPAFIGDGVWELLGLFLFCSLSEVQSQNFLAEFSRETS